MSAQALVKFENASKDQRNRNEARRIRTKVNEARKKISDAGIRWPFELLQNALDAGPCPGKETIDIKIGHSNGVLTFEHTGAPFTTNDLAALLSGGSNKDFESEKTTGRYGTGFLVTHVLAERTRIRGILDLEPGYEVFDLVLDRSGDEDQILDNIEACNEALKEAVPIQDILEKSSAIFKYHLDDDTPVTLGLSELAKSIPYLYITRTDLGKVEIIDEDGVVESWEPSETNEITIDDGYAIGRDLLLKKNETPICKYTITKFKVRKESTSSTLILTKKMDDGQHVCLPNKHAPRVYIDYPVRGSGFLPFDLVIDGKFEPNQEREIILMTEDDETLIKEALKAAVSAISYCVKSKFKQAHLLAKVSRTTTAFDPKSEYEIDWWNRSLKEFAVELAKLPIVENETNFYKAINDDGPEANFVIPTLLENAERQETTVEKLWPLVAETSNLLPPLRHIARDWTDISDGWKSLGIAVNRVTLSTLANCVKENAEVTDNLNVSGDQKLWLARFFDLVGECWKNRTGVDSSFLAGLIPDQNLKLRGVRELNRDEDIPLDLKKICNDAEDDIQSELLLQYFVDLVDNSEFPNLATVLDHIAPKKITTEDVMERIVTNLNSKFQEDKECTETLKNFKSASISFLQYLAFNNYSNASQLAKRTPFISWNNRSIKWSESRMLMAPISTWHKDAQPFADAYPPQRILAEVYTGGNEANERKLFEAVIEWGIAIRDPLSTDRPSELKDRRLAAISSNNIGDVTVTGEQFTQIALLQPEVLNRCQDNKEHAAALLGLVVCYISAADESWKSKKVIKGRRSKDEVEITVTPALWLADLKFRVWVPYETPEGESEKRTADSTSLRDILDPKWLENNDSGVRLLSDFFGFDELDLRLLGVTPNETERQLIRNGLAKIVETVGPDSSLYGQLAEKFANKKKRDRDMSNLRRIGLAIQEEIDKLIMEYGLKTKLIDEGYDYEISAWDTDVFEDESIKLSVGKYLLEIKSSRTGRPCLTPLQAKTASTSKHPYVLCVVDLMNVSEDQINEEWTPEKVEPLAKVVVNIRDKARETYNLIDGAKTTTIKIKNEDALRYEVPASIWQKGVPISSWIADIEKA